MAEHIQRLVVDLVRLMAAGKIGSGSVLPVLRALTRDQTQPIPFDFLVEAVEQQGGPEGTRLADDLRNARLREAARCFRSRQDGQGDDPDFDLLLAGVPRHGSMTWQSPEEFRTPLLQAAREAIDRRFILQFGDATPAAAKLVESRFQRTANAAAPTLNRFAPLLLNVFIAHTGTSTPDELSDQELATLTNMALECGRRNDDSETIRTLCDRFQQAATTEDRRAALDELCSFPEISIAQHISRLVTERSDQHRADLILTCRFGPTAAPGWAGTVNWLARCERQRQDELKSLQQAIKQAPGELLLMWLNQQPGVAPNLLSAVEHWCENHIVPVDPEELADRYGTDIPADEWNLLAGTPVELAPDSDVPERTSETVAWTGSGEPSSEGISEITSPPVTETVPLAAASQAVGRPAAAGSRLPAPPRPPGPSLWSDHVQPFLTEQWYLAAGVLMVLAGSSLVAYYTWDRHWLIRYTLMPLLLGGFTWALAWLADWVEKRDREFLPTAAVLRAAAIGLLPVNFMAVAVLSNDEDVSQKALVVPIMAILYGGIFGYGLKSWCGRVHSQLSWLLGGTLLAINCLVMLAPLARSVASMGDTALNTVMGVGFYAGFLAAAFTVVTFCRQVLTPEMARESRIPWFLGGVLIATFLQVLLWVHGYLHHVPHLATYAPMMILAGGLVLFAERRTQELTTEDGTYRGESFIGFALVLLGILMGVSHPWVRIGTFVLAGLVWLSNGRTRREPVHDWIGLTLIALGVASIGVLPGFPREYLPALGLCMAVALEAAGQLLRIPSRGSLQRTCLELQAAVLMLTTVVAVLVQWDLQSRPLWTAGWLLLTAAFFCYRSWKDHQLRWLHSAMTVVAIALPYLGCIDLEAKTLQGNVIPFGLAAVSVLWLLADRVAQVMDPEGTGRVRLHAARPDGVPEESGPQPSSWQLIREARSTVIWVYGSLAVAAMVLRVLFESDTAHVSRLHMVLDYCGPLMMAAVLGVGTWYSRSLVPAAMAAVIVIILFPEIRATFAAQFEALGWGTGLGGAASALGLIVAVFFVRPAAFLKSPGEGDRFMNRYLFPFRRYDHTLFTWPLIGSALFLTIRTDTVTLARNLSAGPEIRTAVAILLTAVNWTLLAVGYRRLKQAAVATWLGCGCLVIGVALMFDVQWPALHWSWIPLSSGVLLQTLYLLYRAVLTSSSGHTRQPDVALSEQQPSRTYLKDVLGIATDRSWIEPILAAPTKQFLHTGTLLLAAACVIRVQVGDIPQPLIALMAFVSAQLIWHGYASPRPFHGLLLFVLVWVAILAVTAPGAGNLIDRISFDRSFLPTLIILLSVQVMLTAFEFAPDLYRRCCGITIPFQAISSVLVVGLLVWGLLETSLGMTPKSVTGLTFFWYLAATAGVGLLTARSQSSIAIAVVALVLVYTIAHRDVMDLLGVAGLSETEARIRAFLSPWRLGSFGVFLSLCEAIGSRVAAGFPSLVRGPFSQLPFRTTNRDWLTVPALGIAGAAALLHTAVPEHREVHRQLAAPFLASVAWGISGWSRRRTMLYIGAGMLIALGNIHVVRMFLGDVLRPWGISEIQLICVGLAVSLIELTMIRLAARNDILTRSFNQASLALAGLVLALISVNYFVHPNLAEISWQRFAISGAMSWLAALYFRRAARRPMPGEESSVAVAEGMYHFGLTIALWCVVLLIPVFRRPEVALFSVGGPLLWFWLRAETGLRSGQPQAAAWRNSASALGFGILFAYVFRFAFQMVLFPPEDLGAATARLSELLHTHYYHSSAPFIMLVSLVLLRLHGLGGTWWLALYGGLGLVTGSYFTLTWLPDLSPFDQPVAAAWCAIGLTHFWTLVSDQRSPLRTAIQRLAAIDAGQWAALRRIWGLCTLVAVHAAVCWGLFEWSTQPLMVAPLLAGAASVLLHQGAIRRSPVYFAIAAGELLIALHADFLVESYIDRHQIVWVLLSGWAILQALQFAVCFQNGVLPRAGHGTAAAGLAALVFAHVLYHRPWNAVGLWAFAAGALLAGSVPRPSRQAKTGEEQLAAGLPAIAPAWIAYFSQCEIAELGVEGALRSWPLLMTTIAVLLTGAGAAMFQTFLAVSYDRVDRRLPLLADQTLSWFARSGQVIHSCTLVAAFAATGVIQVAHYGRPFGTGELGMTLFLYAALTFGWYHEGRLRRNMVPWVLMQLSVLGFFAVIRRQLMLTTDFWTPQYDVWASLVVSSLLTGFKQQLDSAPRELRIPLMGTLLALPAVALVWVTWNRLGTDVAMLIVGLHSLMFTYMGRDDRESPYNLIATCGFVAFVLMLFWSRLQLRVIHAYTIPAGIGVLAMLHLLRRRVNPETRNRVRLITLLMMIGSVGYYALLDTRYPVAFHLTMIVVCLAAMGCGSLFRIRLYLLLGFSGLLVDLASIMYRFVAGIDERGTRMSIIGSLVLVVGVSLVLGAIYFRTHRVQVAARTEDWKRKLGGWE